MGQAISPDRLITQIESVFFINAKHVVLWVATYDVSIATEMSYSPGEELARSIEKNSVTYRMVRMSDPRPERVRVVLRSSLCNDEPLKPGLCLHPDQDEIELTAEMTCRVESPP